MIIGATGFAGFALADVLRAEAGGSGGSSIKSVINVHLDGGPPQHDTIDPKPDAPEEVRGEFKPIVTRVKAGFSPGATDDYGYFAAEDKVHVHDLHATILHLLGLDQTRLTYRHAGRDFRLTDVHGAVVKEILL